MRSFAVSASVGLFEDLLGDALVDAESVGRAVGLGGFRELQPQLSADRGARGFGGSRPSGVELAVTE